MRRYFKASVTIEAAVIIPLVIFIFGGILTILFYYHDKNIITGAVYEIAVLGSSEDEIVKEELGTELQERVNRKLLLFSTIYVDIQIEETSLKIYCRSSKNGMMLYVQVSMSRTNPETFIRNIRKIERIESQMGDKL